MEKKKTSISAGTLSKLALCFFLIGVSIIIAATILIVQTDKLVESPDFLEGLASYEAKRGSGSAIQRYVQSSDYQAKAAQRKAKDEADAKKVKYPGAVEYICGGSLIAWSVYAFRKSAIMRKQHE